MENKNRIPNPLVRYFAIEVCQYKYYRVYYTEYIRIWPLY